MNRLKLILLPFAALFFLGSAYASSGGGDKEIIVFIECKGDQSVFDTAELVLKNRPYFEEKGIKVTFSRAKGCGYLLVNKIDMIKLDASLTEKELLEQCKKFFVQAKGK